MKVQGDRDKLPKERDLHFSFDSQRTLEHAGTHYTSVAILSVLQIRKYW